MLRRNIFGRGIPGLKRNGRIIAYLMIGVGAALILIWLPIWIWFVMAGIILILLGIDIYKK